MMKHYGFTVKYLIEMTLGFFNSIDISKEEIETDKLNREKTQLRY